MRKVTLFITLFAAAAFGQLDQLGGSLGRLAKNGQSTVKRIEFNVEPKTLKIRPLTTAVVQVKVYGDFTGKDNQTREGRLREAGWNITATGGWVSKPFRFQGKDSEAFVDNGGGLMGSIFKSTTSQFTLKDSIVYHAPEQPGKYRVEAALGSVKGAVEIEVDPNADYAYTPQKITFGQEPPIADPYRRIAEHYSPYVAQETWFQWTADALCRADFDDDWDAGNNWDSLGKGSTQAYVYYAAMEGQSHWFLIYNFFHARDYSDNCVAGTCHENDNEGMILTIRKDGSEFGKLETMETLAHNNVYSYVNDSAITNGAHNVEGNVAFFNGSHPVVFLEAGGHGALGGTDKKSFFDAKDLSWKQNTGITYIYKGVAERPKHGMDHDVGYELLPIYHHWWVRATRATAGEFLSAFYNYQPLGGRPGMKLPEVAGAFAGKEHGEDKAKPFWGWHDTATQRRKILATGQWATDPAYSVTRNLTFPASRPVSLEYVFNPYLNTPEPPMFEIVRNIQNGELAPGAPYAGPAPRMIAGGVPTGPAVGPVPVPAPGAPAAAREGSCEISVRVDGTVFLKLENTVPRFEVVSGAPPEERGTSCTGAAPANGDFRVAKREGRGTVRMTDPQTGRIEIADAARGAGDYKLVVRWTANPGGPN